MIKKVIAIIVIVSRKADERATIKTVIARIISANLNSGRSTLLAFTLYETIAMTMKLYDSPISSACARVRIALALKGLSVELIGVSIGAQPDNRAADYLRINPQGLVPALLAEDGSLLTQSLAIVEYLDERHPHPALLPAGLEERARVRAVALAVAAETHALLTFRVAGYLNALPASDTGTMPAWRRHWIIDGLDAVEALLARDRRGRLCAGDTPTLADVFLYPQALNAERAGIALARWPTIAAVMEQLRTFPAFVDNGPALPKLA